LLHQIVATALQQSSRDQSTTITATRGKYVFDVPSYECLEKMPANGLVWIDGGKVVLDFGADEVVGCVVSAGAETLDFVPKAAANDMFTLVEPLGSDFVVTHAAKVKLAHRHRADRIEVQLI